MRACCCLNFASSKAHSHSKETQSKVKSSKKLEEPTTNNHENQRPDIKKHQFKSEINLGFELKFMSSKQALGYQHQQQFGRFFTD